MEFLEGHPLSFARHASYWSSLEEPRCGVLATPSRNFPSSPPGFTRWSAVPPCSILRSYNTRTVHSSSAHPSRSSLSRTVESDTKADTDKLGLFAQPPKGDIPVIIRTDFTRERFGETRAPLFFWALRCWAGTQPALGPPGPNPGGWPGVGSTFPRATGDECPYAYDRFVRGPCGNACRATHGKIGRPRNTKGSPSNTVVI